MTDYYKTLGISPQATDKEIKSSYRKLAKQYHPDVVGDDADYIKRMYEIQEAYKTLGEPDKRKLYDKNRLAQKSQMGAKVQSRKCGGNDDGSPAPDMSQFEHFFGFRPGKGMETCQDTKSGTKKADAPLKPEEMFASFFRKIK